MKAAILKQTGLKKTMREVEMAKPPSAINCEIGKYDKKAKKGGDGMAGS